MTVAEVNAGQGAYSTWSRRFRLLLAVGESCVSYERNRTGTHCAEQRGPYPYVCSRGTFSSSSIAVADRTSLVTAPVRSGGQTLQCDDRLSPANVLRSAAMVGEAYNR